MVAADSLKNFELAEHQVSVLLSFEGVSQHLTKFGDLCAPLEATEGAVQYDRNAAKPAADCFPEHLKPAMNERYKDDEVLKCAKVNEGGDLYQPIQRILNGELGSKCAVFDLTDRAKGVLNGGNLFLKDHPLVERFKSRLGLRLNPAQIQRLKALDGDGAVPGLKFSKELKNGKRKECFFLPLNFEDLRVYRFNTGRAICLVKIALDEKYVPETDTLLLSELTDRLGRFADLEWFREEMTSEERVENYDGGSKFVLQKGFSLADICARIVLGRHAISQNSHRSFTHVFGRVHADADVVTRASLEAKARVLARQYTGDYALALTNAGGHVVSDFENVVHVAYREGAASLVDPRVNGATIEALENFAKDRLKQTYLPLVVLNFFQVCEALSINARTVIEAVGAGDLSPVDSQANAATVNDWEALRDQQVDLRANFRFHQVSRISMHNAWNKALRRAFDLDDIEAQLSQDILEKTERVREAVGRQAEQKQEEHRKSLKWIAIAGAGVAGALATVDLLALLTTYVEDGKLGGWETASLALLLALVVLLGVIAERRWRQ